MSGFCLTPSIPYAWQPKGSVIDIPTSAHNQRLNVTSFMNRHNDIFPYIVEGKVDTSIITECFDHFSQYITQRTYVLLDNAAVQKSQEFISHIPAWVNRGLIIKYLLLTAPN